MSGHYSPTSTCPLKSSTHQDILRLDVCVQDVFLVCPLDRPRELLGPVEPARLVEALGMRSSKLQDVAKRAELEQQVDPWRQGERRGESARAWRLGWWGRCRLRHRDGTSARGRKRWIKRVREERELALPMARIWIDEDRLRMASAFAPEPPCCRGRSRGRRHLAHRNVACPVEIGACTSEWARNGLTAAVAESKARTGRSRHARRQRRRRIEPVALVAYSVEANDV